MKLVYCFLLILIAVNCTTRHVPELKTVDVPNIHVIEATEVMGPKVWKTPEYVIPADAHTSFKTAVEYIRKYGNSDQFFEYVTQKNIQRFTHEPLPAREALAKFRGCLDQGGIIPIVWKPTIYPSVIGNYSNGKIKENPAKALTAIERAGHLYHETSHKCGFKHMGNEWDKNDNLNSFPYVIGYALEDFIEAQEKTILAGAQ